MSLNEKLKNEIESIVNAIATELDIKDSTREEALKLSREVLRDSSDVITYIHIGQYEKAREILEKLKEKVLKLLELVDPHIELKYSGFINNAFMEYAEAAILYGIVVEGRIPRPEELHIYPVPYILGLCDAVGELKRHTIELLRQNKLDEAFQYIDLMEHIYNILKKLDYPEALTPGLRHKIDIMRRIIEDLKTFSIDISKRIELIERLEAVSKCTMS